MLRVADRVKETSTTTGTGALSLAGAVTGYQTFSAVCSNGDTCYYSIVAVDGNGVPTGNWETGLGTYNTSGNTLSRAVNFSNNSNALVNFTTGTVQVFIDVTATHMKAIMAAASIANISGV